MTAVYWDNHTLFTHKSFNLMPDECGLVRTDLKQFSYENDPLFRRRRTDRIKTIAQVKVFADACNLKYKEYDFRTYHYVVTAQQKPQTKACCTIITLNVAHTTNRVVFTQQTVEKLKKAVKLQ